LLKLPILLVITAIERILY